MTALGGPQAMLGWIVTLVIVICDRLVWSELGAAMPGAGGSFGYLREALAKAIPVATAFEPIAVVERGIVAAARMVKVIAAVDFSL